MKVPNRVVIEADNLSKETHLSFRDCLDILMRMWLQDEVGQVSVSSDELEQVGRLASV